MTGESWGVVAVGSDSHVGLKTLTGRRWCSAPATKSETESPPVALHFSGAATYAPPNIVFLKVPDSVLNVAQRLPVNDLDRFRLVQLLMHVILEQATAMLSPFYSAWLHVACPCIGMQHSRIAGQGGQLLGLS